MRLLKRMNTIISAQLNEIIDGFEKPEPMLKQVIREMESAVQRAMESTAKAIAAEKRLTQELADSRTQAVSWRQLATDALNRGKDSAARAAIARSVDQEMLSTALSKQLVHVGEKNARLRKQLDAMRLRLSDAHRQLAMLIARQRSADARQQFVKVLGRFDADVDTFHRFSEMSKRISESEAETEAIEDLCGADFDDPVRGEKIEAELQNLKRDCPPRPE